MIFQKFILEYLSTDFSTYICTPPQGWPKPIFESAVGEYRCGSKNQSRDIPK